MDNENNVVTEEVAKTVRKVVLKRQPVAKKAVVQQVEAVVEKEPIKAPEVPEVSAAPEVSAESAPTPEVVPESTPEEGKKQRKPKQNKAKGSKKKADKKEDKPVEASEATETTEATVGTAEKPTESAVETAVDTTTEEKATEAETVKPETEESNTEEDKEQRFKNHNQHNNKNRNFDKHNKQDQRNNQKKVFTMEELAIPESEYQEHLSHRIIVRDLSVTHTAELKERLAAMAGTSVDDYAEYKKQEVVVEILKTFSQNGGVIYAIGTLEILSEGYGFLRSPLNSYLSGPEDVYVAPGIIKFLNLKTGDTIEGIIRTPKENERFFAIARIAYVNGYAPIVAKTRTSFDNLIPLYPDQRINLETERTDNDVSMRVINLFCPIGKGQRALITAPPRTGKTILLQQIANSITENHPEINLIVLLVDERPEEVTDMRRNVKGEVIASTFDEQATRHVTVAEMVIEKAKRLVEHKKDVVILLDSITRLARAYNQTVPASGKILSGGVDSNALHKPKRFFGAARNIENGGSLTIIASALIETGSRMDEVIFEEFKGTGNSEIVLDRRMADRRVYPAINIKKSGTRREDLLLEQGEAAKIWLLRNFINGMEDLEITEFLVDKMRKTKNNEAFLRSMNTGTVPVV